MTANRTGSGEPSVTLRLLWGTPAETAPRKGPARSVAVPQIVDAALALADEDGLAALTMRAVAQRVGISPMSVYTYVPGKPELLDLMVDALYARSERREWRAESWRERLTAVAEANRTLLTEHPWMTEVAALSRPPLGPGLMAKYEHELAAFDDTGLADVDIDASLTFLLGFVQSHCRAAHDAHRATTDSAMSDADWWAANQPILEHALDAAAYPRAVRIGASAGEAQNAAWSETRSWEFGLARVLDALALLIEPRAPFGVAER
ncbi:TetR/AcrR family transcriptional regulator [Microbacterium sp. NPDC058345]|uniref:TetR/AcrR family transcriptional regulator n=1 Tax=Microbacterium sp. NPDC058345 TaxID=3346455 RepID=UPI003669111F